MILSERMKRLDSLKSVAPELAKEGVTLKSFFGNTDGSRASKSDLLSDRANLRRLINSESRKDSDADADVLAGASYLINEINIKLDENEGGHGFRGATSSNNSNRSGNVVHDTSGQRIGVRLDAATLRDEQAIATALSGMGASRNGGQGIYADCGNLDASVPDGERGGLADFFRGVAGGKTTPTIRASLSEGTDTSGGYAVPSWVLAPIIRGLTPASAMLAAGASMVVIDKPGDSFIIPAVDTIPTPAWRLEAGNVTIAGPTFRAVTIVPRDLSFIFKVSRELLQDAPGMDLALNQVISQAFAKEIDRAGLIGSGGAPEIRGVLNTTGVLTYDMGTDGAALADYSPVIKAARLIADENAPAPTALITSNREAETIDLFHDTTNQPLRRPPALEQMNFIATSQIPLDDTHGAASDASTMFLGNWGFATFYMREQLSVMRLSELYAGTGEIGFACHARLDLALAYPTAFCAIKGVIP